LVSLSVATLILSGGFALRMRLQGQELLWHAYWLSLAVTLPAAYVLLRPDLKLSPRLGVFLWGLLLTGDAVALVAGLPTTRPEDEVFAPSPLVRSLTPPGRVFDHIGPSSNSPLGSGAPLARLAGVESVRGFDPLDLLRYKEYLQFIAGTDVPIRPFEHPLAFPIMGDLEIRNKPLLDLLGVRYLLRPEDVPGNAAETGADWSPVARDDCPEAFDCCSRAGGRQPLPPYTVYENATVFPRAFVVHRARPLPPREEALAALTATDLRKEVLLEGDDVSAEGSVPAEARSARISDYCPNRVTVDVGDGPAGWLVLADIWYPGWRCTLDGAEVPVRRADFLFRAVAVPAGRHDVVFTFAPKSYRIGRLISLATLGLLTAGLAVSLRSMRGGWRSGQ
jgi:hypothetical protein